MDAGTGTVELYQSMSTNPTCNPKTVSKSKQSSGNVQTSKWNNQEQNEKPEMGSEPERNQ